MIKHILFDLDGTLTDPFVGITSAFSYALSKFGIKIHDMAELKRVIGPPLSDSFSSFYGLTGENCQSAVKYYREYYSKKGIFQNAIYDGIPELLSKLKNQGKQIYLSTSKPEEYAKIILQHFNIECYFDFIAGNNLKDERHTKSKVIDYILKCNPQISPSQCLMVGDRKFDIEGAKEFSLTSVGVYFGYAEENELEASGADYIVFTVEELQQLLLSL